MLHENNQECSACMAEYLKQKNERLATEKAEKESYDRYFGLGEFADEEAEIKCKTIKFHM